MPVYLLSDELIFPSPKLAAQEGLLAVGGDLSQERLLLAYRMGIFPWYSENEPIMWWSPDPRLILYPDRLKISKSLKKVINKGDFALTMDQNFKAVIRACAKSRTGTNEGTWIVDEIIAAYCKLHESGLAHSVETWMDGQLAGGLYGVSIGRCFFGESMFTRISNASKVALVGLVRYLQDLDFDLIDCQVSTPHLLSLGAHEIPRARFLDELATALKEPTLKGRWSFPSSTPVQSLIQ
ncbi:MAG: leucyl/phenylalanyl-tRNA--protein transferase [Deltaproteobacteria bacterium]|jgi:leucyl/phenylalanyl-tRNA--protein transferase|nr:leucyl/phenylalanyl-tRNA--protein transferase [Deltaproteobacteria bacterium]MBW2486035.1 leucyl/phenylalanyl-tRNA--protein transferase [Deltaproteobacteria bacterium]